MQRIKNFLTRVFPQRTNIFPVKLDHRVEFAFEADGIKYFEFSDANNIPCERAFSAIALYEELNMRCTREYLQAHAQAVEDAINDRGGISITNLAKLNQQLKERLDLIFEPELVYKLASVIYFDETENPYKYDFKYGIEKVARWKKQNIADFFLSLPIKKLLPQTDLSNQDLEDYSRITKALTKEHLDSIFTIASGKSRKSELFNTLASQAQEE